MTLTEKIHEHKRQSEQGNYSYTVEVWRSDTQALANLRVRLKVYRVRERARIFSSAHKVNQATETATRSTLDTTFEEMIQRGNRMLERYEKDLSSASGLAHG